MRRLRLNGRGLAVQERGEGAAVLLLHPGLIADGMLPLFADETLAAGRRLVRYHRRGYGHSGQAEPPVSLVQQAGDALAVLDALDIDRVDLVGHSFGANVALEVAISAADRVRSLVLMEPLLAFALTPDTARYVAEAAEVAVPLYQRGDPAGAVDAWLSRAFGPGYRDPLERTLPGALDQATRDSAAAPTLWPSS
jgi:pimeloyl-ACP methyl ester carboxylesterase